MKPQCQNFTQHDVILKSKKEHFYLYKGPCCQESFGSQTSLGKNGQGIIYALVTEKLRQRQIQDSPPFPQLCLPYYLSVHSRARQLLHTQATMVLVCFSLENENVSFLIIPKSLREDREDVDQCDLGHISIPEQLLWQSR